VTANDCKIEIVSLVSRSCLASRYRPVVETDRLILRAWREADLAPFAALNADPLVMEHFPKLLSREDSDAIATRIEAKLRATGFGLWAVEVKSGAPFIGFVGLNVPTIRAPFMPAHEIGWRLAREGWGHGYATEAALACVRFAFGELGLAELVSMTVPGNLRSRAVMERLGMTRDPADDFDHEGIPEGHPLRRHVLYRLARP